MIALDIPMPRSCLDCPCLDTSVSKNMVLRTCAVTQQQVIFPKPSWCPWKEVPRETHEVSDEYWHASMAGLGGSYEY